jgi:hypothetical protein
MAIYRDLAIQERALHSRSLSWPCGLKSLPDLGSPLASGRNEWSEAHLVRRGEVICHARIARSGFVQVRIATSERQHLDDAEAELRRLLPRPRRSDDGTSTLLRFWNCSPHGAQSTSRRIAVPRWEDVESNYPAGTRKQLDLLMNGHRPGAGGQLLLWHGPPGTGKTFALRSLLWQWRDWCDAHFILDPETFFGGRPDYMVEVALAQADSDDDASHDPGSTQDVPFGGGADPQDLGEKRFVGERWRMLILEDAGELLAADAKERAGQGLSRLLNVVDGLVGQGLRLLILVTGNEPLQRLHPALSRPGRCGSVVEFFSLDQTEASGWLAAHQSRA